jgi:HK97 family phage prohead protease
VNDYTRSWPLDDIRIRSGGDGRTVEAYAAVFNTPAKVVDQDGHYQEVIHPAAFNKTLKDNGLRFGVFYNHGLTIHGTPDGRYSMPIGTPLEVRADTKGLFTVTRYNRTPVADEVLEAIHAGSIRAQSFSGRFVRSDPARRRSQLFRPNPDGTLRTVVRLESTLREYGPTPLPAYAGAEITGVRAQLLGALLDAPSDQQVALLQLLTRQGPSSTGTSDAEAAQSRSDEPLDEHSSRHQSLRDQIRRARIARGIE